MKVEINRKTYFSTMKIFDQEINSEDYLNNVINLIFKRLLDADVEVDSGEGEQAPKDNKLPRTS